MIPTLPLESDFEQIKNLYLYTRDLYSLFEEISIKNDIDIGKLFAPFIEQWLSRTDKFWIEWVDRAFLADEASNFTPEYPPNNLVSNSASTIFSFLENGLELFSEFVLMDNFQKSRLNRHFIKAVTKAMERYCLKVFEAFSEIDKSKKKDFVFTREFVTKTNNLLYCRYNLNEMLAKLIDKNSDISKHSKRTEPKTGVAQFCVSIISASNVAGKDPIWRTSDCFATVQLGKENYGNTVIQHNTCFPVWNETVPIPIELPEYYDNSQSFLSLTIKHNATASEIDCGSCEVFLRDSQFDDYLQHDYEYKLKPCGTINLRIRKMGEIDETNWYVRRTEEILKSTIEDMVYMVLLNSRFAHT